MVGVLMLESVARIDFRDPTELLPAFVTIVMMVFTYSIANGLVAGLAMAPVLKAAAGRWREIPAGSVVLAALCITYFIWGLPH